MAVARSAPLNPRAEFGHELSPSGGGAAPDHSNHPAARLVGAFRRCASDTSGFRICWGMGPVHSYRHAAQSRAGSASDRRRPLSPNSPFMRDEHWNRNFAAFFPIWDWLFGTVYIPKPMEYPPVGLKVRPRGMRLRDYFL